MNTSYTLHVEGLLVTVGNCDILFSLLHVLSCMWPGFFNMLRGVYKYTAKPLVESHINKTTIVIEMINVIITEIVIGKHIIFTK